MLTPFSRRDLFRALLVVVITTIFALWAYGLFSRAAWETTPRYDGDAVEILARLKLAQETGFDAWRGKSLPRLGAPFEASWAAYPQPDQWLFWLGGKLSGAIGLIPTTHVLVLFAHGTAAAAFFLSARFLGHRVVWAAVFGILYGLSNFNFYRGLTHFSFTLSFTIPPMLVAAWYIGSGRRLRSDASIIFAGVALAFFSGAGNQYYTFFLLQLITGAWLFQYFTQRRAGNLWAGGLLFGLTLVVTVASNAPTLFERFTDGKADPLVRNYAASELYALRPIELLVPPAHHHFPVFADFGRYYAGVTSQRGELPSPYLGVVAAGGLAAMLIDALRRLLTQRAGLRPSHAPWALWFMMMGAVGGLQAPLALVGLQYFRAGNRYSVVLVALSLFFLSRILSRSRWLGQTALRALSLAAILLGLGLWDQFPPLTVSATAARAAQKIQDDRALAQVLETLHPKPALVFQLPAVPFPEHPTVGAMTDYAQFRPYLFTRSTRFSYGTLTGTEQMNWQRWVSQLPTRDMVTALETSGFHALCINRLAYTDRAAVLTEELLASGCVLLFGEARDSEWVLFKLATKGSPVPPNLQDLRLARTWNNTPISATPTKSKILLGDGWDGLEKAGDQEWRWAGRQGTLKLWNPTDMTYTVSLRFAFASNKPGRLVLLSEKKILWENASGATLQNAPDVSLALPPGLTEVIFRYQGKITRPSTGDSRLLGFKIQNLQLIPAAGPPPAATSQRE